MSSCHYFVKCDSFLRVDVLLEIVGRVVFSAYGEYVNIVTCRENNANISLSHPQ